MSSAEEYKHIPEQKKENRSRKKLDSPYFIE
jgi:hypothetical protein